jgi:uncharacterized protein with GYD domain
VIEGGESIRFIVLIKFKTKLTEEMVEKNLDLMDFERVHEGVRMLDLYWTLGRYDAVVVMEGPDERAAMRSALRRMDSMDMETMVAVPAVEARTLVE